MREQTLEVVRGEIISALSVDVRTQGQLDFDASMITNFGRRVRAVDEVTGQRIEKDPVRGRSGRTFKRSSCPLPPNAFFLTRITRAVNMQPEHLKSLALYAYAERCDWHHVETVAKHLWDDFKDQLDKPLREKKEKTLRNMVFLAMQNWKHQRQTDTDLHQPQRIRELLGISEHTWRRDWLPYWRQFHQLLSNTDEQVVKNVYRSTTKKATNQRIFCTA